MGPKSLEWMVNHRRTRGKPWEDGGFSWDLMGTSCRADEVSTYFNIFPVDCHNDIDLIDSFVFPPLVNVHITLEHHHFSWENSPISMAMFNSYVCLPEGKPPFFHGFLLVNHHFNRRKN